MHDTSIAERLQAGPNTLLRSGESPRSQCDTALHSLYIGHPDAAAAAAFRARRCRPAAA